MRSTLARPIKPANNAKATVHNFGVPVGGPLRPGFGLSGDVQILDEKRGFGRRGGPSFRTFAKNARRGTPAVKVKIESQSRGQRRRTRVSVRHGKNQNPRPCL